MRQESNCLTLIVFKQQCRRSAVSRYKRLTYATLTGKDESPRHETTGTREFPAVMNPTSPVTAAKTNVSYYMCVKYVNTEISRSLQNEERLCINSIEILNWPFHLSNAILMVK